MATGQVPQRFFLAARRDGTITASEGDALRAFTPQPKELIGRRLTALGPTGAVLAAGMAQLLEGRPRTDELALDGRRFAVEYELTHDEAGRVDGVLVFARSDAAGLPRGPRSLEERLADAQSIAHVGSWEWDIAAKRVTWSDELHRIYGLSPGTFGSTYEDFLARVHPEDRALTERTVLAALRTGEPFTYDHRVIRADGQVRTLHTRGAPVMGEDGRPVRLAGSCWDITELRSAQDALESSASLLRATLESTADGLLVVDLSGRVESFNQRLLDLWNIPRSLVEHADFEQLLTFVHPALENAEECLLHVRELAARPEAESFDSLHFHDGRVFERYSRPQRIGDRVVGRVWSYRDVTDREGLLRRVQFLADASRLLASLDIEQALEGVARLAVRALADACAVDLFEEEGGPRRLLSISRDPARPVPVELLPRVLQGEAALRTEGALSTIAAPVMGRGGILGVLTMAIGAPRRFGAADLALLRELAGRVALSVENARLYRHAGEALEARDEFLSIAAHEIRGPVTALHLAAQGLKAGTVTAGAGRKMLDVIEREDRRLARFVNELLDVAQTRAGGFHFDLAPVDLAEVTREAIARLAPEVTHSRSALSVTASGPVVGLWDRARLEQVVVNLVSNALKFGLGRPIEVSVTNGDEGARLVVRDRGIGIAPENQRRIFEPFERAVSARHYGGLGLGLYITRRIAEGLGGTVSVASQPDEGSTFTVFLPRGGAR